MTTLKEDVINAISHIDESADIDDIMYQLYVIDKIRKGQEAIINNQVISSEELKKEIQGW